MTMYKVVGHCAHATVNTPHGRVQQLHFKGAVLPSDVPDSEIRHLLSVGLIRPTDTAPATPQPDTGEGAAGSDGNGGDGGDAEPGGDPAGEGGQGPAGDPTTGDTGGEAGPAEPDPEVEAKRAAAREKLPTDGSAPDKRAAQAVWVEYLVGKGYDYDALAKQDKKTLIDLASGNA